MATLEDNNMKVTIEYNLPDDVDLYKEAMIALTNKAENRPTPVRELRTAIVKYMLQPQKPEYLNYLNEMLDKHLYGG